MQGLTTIAGVVKALPEDPHLLDAADTGFLVDTGNSHPQVCSWHWNVERRQMLNPDKQSVADLKVMPKTTIASAGCCRLMQCHWHYATREKSYFKVNSLTTATRDSRFFQIFFSPLGLSP